MAEWCALISRFTSSCPMVSDSLAGPACTFCRQLPLSNCTSAPTRRLGGSAVAPAEFHASNAPYEYLIHGHHTLELGAVVVVSGKGVSMAGTWLHSMQDDQFSACRLSRDRPEKYRMPAGVRCCPHPGCRDQCCALTRMMRH